jgi:protein phosphatase
MAYLRAVGLTHRGAVRSGNEDCIAIDAWMTQRSMSAPVYLETAIEGTTLCLVCDGMGGREAGEVASLIAARGLIARSRDLVDAESVGAALIAANQAVFDAMRDKPELTGMGTTVAGVALGDGEALIFNVGDSRVYAQNGAFLRLLSTDDTLAATHVGGHERTGQASHGILQCLGGADAFVPISPHVQRLSIRPSEGSPQAFDARFLLCSDGLTDMLDQDAIESCLDPDPVATCKALFEAAMREGGQDNISVIVAEYASAGWLQDAKR